MRTLVCHFPTALWTAPCLRTASHYIRKGLSLTAMSLLCLAAMGISAPSAASVSVQVSASFFSEDDSTGDTGQLTQSAFDGTVSQSANLSSLGSGGNSTATADLGVLKASATAGAIRGDIFNGNASKGSAYAGASWSDAVTVSGAGLTGTGWANARIYISSVSGDIGNSGTAGSGGSFSGLASGSCRLFANSTELFSFSTQAQLTESGTVDGSTFTWVNGADYAGNLGGFWNVSIPLMFNQAFSLSSTLSTSAHATAGSNSAVSSFAEFGNSIYWGGITSITLADGSTTTAFAALGATGHDWAASAAPVPEAEVYSLLLAGLSLIAVVSRRKMPTK